MDGYLKRAQRQGWLDSGALYLHSYSFFLAKRLAIKIKDNQNINGIAINNRKNITNDFTLVPKNVQSQNALDTINTFCRKLALKLM